jgi:hypothetical protein
MTQGACPVVYVGPTISADTARTILPSAEVRPPISREQLYRDREAGHSIFLIIDGVFACHEAVSPREVIDVARDGALVVGASSIGALRAAECWPVGVCGVGVVYRAFRMGILKSDGEVAVTMDQEREYRALSVALVNVRYAVSRAARHRLVDRLTAARMVDCAASTFYSERQWRGILGQAGIADESGDLECFLAARDIKRRDAVSALEHVRDLLHARTADHGRKVNTPFERVRRERFEPYFGESPEMLRGELTEWLFGTGRYKRYLWPLLAGHEAFAAQPQDGRAARLREVLSDVLTDILRADTDLTACLWEELVFIGELHAEIARMYATRRLASDAERTSIAIDPAVLARVREEVSIAHDAYNWASLVDNVFDGRLCGAIPFAWIERACDRSARARSYVMNARRRSHSDEAARGAHRGFR